MLSEDLMKIANLPPRKRAEWEFDNLPGARDGYANRESYIASRVAEMTCGVKSFTPMNLSTLPTPPTADMAAELVREDPEAQARWEWQNHPHVRRGTSEAGYVAYRSRELRGHQHATRSKELTHV